MTVLVGIIHDGRTWIGGDSSEVSGYMLGTCELTPKVWQQGPFVIGFTGETREQQIIQYATTLPEIPDGVDVLRYLCVDFVNAVRQARKDSGYEEKETRGQEAGPQMLIGYEDRLFTLYANYGISEHSEYAVHGCGLELAYGSLHTSAQVWKSAKRRIHAALAAACSAHIYCKPPFVILSSP